MNHLRSVLVLPVLAGCYQTMRPVEFAPERIDSVAACVERTIHNDGYEMRAISGSDGILAWTGVRRQLADNQLFDSERVGASIRSPRVGGPAELHVSAAGETQPKMPEVDPYPGSTSRMRAELTAWRVLDCAKPPKTVREAFTGPGRGN